MRIYFDESGQTSCVLQRKDLHQYINQFKLYELIKVYIFNFRKINLNKNSNIL